MSEKLKDKIVNHLISNYVLIPLIEPLLIDSNVAIRKNKGTAYGFNLLKKYINKLKENYNNIYVLKIDIIKSSDGKYVNEDIIKAKNKILNKEDNLKSILKLPLYKQGKGLPIGNLSSQILAIYYLNEIDHYIKEKLKLKYYIRYLDDFVIYYFKIKRIKVRSK